MASLRRREVSSSDGEQVVCSSAPGFGCSYAGVRWPRTAAARGATAGARAAHDADARRWWCAGRDAGSWWCAGHDGGAHNRWFAGQDVDASRWWCAFRVFDA